MSKNQTNKKTNQRHSFFVHKRNSIKILKNYLFIFLLFLSPFFGAHAQSFDLFEGDTINCSDENNNKQGNWIIFKNRTTQKLQEGTYLKGKKEGIWKSYYVNGNIKSEISYIQGKKKGDARIFYENGNIAEEGTWMVDKWVGKYKSYYRNGKLSYLWNYNDLGTRSGYQQYFYENGNIKIEGEWQEGKEQGVIKEYYETGALRVERNFSSGKCETSTIKIYSENETVTSVETDVKENNVLSENSNSDTIIIEAGDTLEIFSGNGIHVFYNKNKQTEKEGEFTSGILTNGKHYIYDDVGKLIKTAVYKQGKIIEIIVSKETEKKDPQ